MQLNDHEKVSCATYMLKKDASYLWDIMRQGRDPAQMLWTEFQNLFNNKYYSTVVTQAKIAEFTNLQQRNLSIAEHICTFDQLARFAPSLVSTEKSRIHHFMEGLKPEIARDVEMGINGPATYAMVIEKALRAEHHKKKISVTSTTRPVTEEPSMKLPFQHEKEKIQYPPIQGTKRPFHQAQGSRKQGIKHRGQFD